MRPPLPPILSILDPDSLLGREVAERVAQAFPHIRLRLFHSRDVEEHLVVQVAGRPLLVSPLADLDELDGSLAVIVTAAPTVSQRDRLLAWLRVNPAVKLVDCTQPGIAGGDATTVVATPPVRRSARAWFHLIDAGLAGPARLLGALAPLKPERFHLTVLSPASSFGSEALEELAAQGAARLSGKSPRPPEYLPGVLAFDAAPAAGPRSDALERQLRELFPSLAQRLSLADAGVFHGHLASASVCFAREVTSEEVRALLRRAPGLHVARRNEKVTVSGAVDDDRVICCDLRAEGRWVSAWLVSDGLRLGGAGAVVELLTALLAY